MPTEQQIIDNVNACYPGICPDIARAEIAKLRAEVDELAAALADARDQIRSVVQAKQNTPIAQLPIYFLQSKIVQYGQLLNKFSQP